MEKWSPRVARKTARESEMGNGSKGRELTRRQQSLDFLFVTTVGNAERETQSARNVEEVRVFRHNRPKGVPKRGIVAERKDGRVEVQARREGRHRERERRQTVLSADREVDLLVLYGETLVVFAEVGDRSVEKAREGEARGRVDDCAEEE
jgi:hypothetical protein